MTTDGNAAWGLEPVKRRMSLASVTKGRVERPVRVLVYGPEGIGKSTFAADAPGPIFLGAEDGTSELDVVRFPEPDSWKDVFDAIEELRESNHEYTTLALDTLDWLEPLCWEHVCFAGSKKSIEDFGYGKGYVAALDEWRRLLDAFDDLRNAKRMHVVLLAHSHIKSFKNPEGDDFDRYELKLHQKAASLVKEWCDAVLFANYETFTKKDGQRVRGIASGARLIHTQRMAAWDAKNRYDLPETLPLSWEEFASAVAAHRPADPAQLEARIVEMIPKLPADRQDKATAALKRDTGNAAKLAILADKITAMIGGE